VAYSKKKRSARSTKDDFGFSDATKMLTGTIVFGTTALVGTNIINRVANIR
jgi:hypothetical protein